MNFKEETIKAIEDSGHKLKDVMFIGSIDGKKRMSIEKFLEVSDFEYDDSYGAAEIYINLIIYFKDKSYIKRGEYDGSEWWEYNNPINYNENDKFETFETFELGMWEEL